MEPRDIETMEPACGRSPLPEPSSARTRSASSLREAIPRVAAYLAERYDATFRRETVVHAATPPQLGTSRGIIEAAAIVVCPGDDFLTLHADRIAGYDLTRCKLHT